MNPNQYIYLSLKTLVQTGGIECDIEIARRVEANIQDAVGYFLNDFSRPMLEYIGKDIMHRTGIYANGVIAYSPSVYGEYYEFISYPIVGEIPQWRKLSLYKGKNNARLITYVSTITIRHFVKVRNNELQDPLKKISDPLQENQATDALIQYNDFDGDALSSQNPELGWAWERLSEKDREVLTVLVIDEVPPIDAYDTLIRYVDRKTLDSTLSTKEKQIMMALLKHRAKKHLLSLIVKYRDKQKR